MIDLDDHDQLVLYDSQGLLAQAAAWQRRQPAGGVSEGVARLLARCLPEHPLADNPAKQLARQMNERIPLFWADARLTSLAQEWQRRVLHYAEAAALSAGLDTLARDWSMARFPRYFPNAVTAVWLRDGREAEDDRSLGERVQLLLRRRGFAALEVELAGADAAEAYWCGGELGEWVALYLAALYGVDPSDRVPWQFLGVS